MNDDIYIFLPGIPPEEYVLRARLRSARNIATKALAESKNDYARSIYTMICEIVGDWIYAPSSLGELEECVGHCLRLWHCADKLEQWR